MPRYPITLPALDPLEVPAQTGTIYPAPYDAVVKGRAKRRLAKVLGLKQFGVNITTLAAGAASSMRHHHSACDEFVYVLDGEVTLITNGGEQVLTTGMCAGFPAGKKDAHHFVNQGDRPVFLLEVGTNVLPDSIVYPDTKLFLYEDEKGRPTFSTKPIKPAPNKAKAKRR
ncbi:MAG: cupin domain-containing protein [Rhodospirillaceae bacterium]|nr:cupin domain-containing protein [Rhodospirillaceae bacterium]